MTTRRPTIGVFDSGFGGLTVLKALLELIPDADYLYFGDTARLPYGSKSVETVARYAVEAAHYLEGHGAELLVIACNTATALALDRITAAAHVPVVGVVEPGAEAAASVTKNKKVVVIGTEATVSSHAYRKALEARSLNAREKLARCWSRWWKKDGWSTLSLNRSLVFIWARLLPKASATRTFWCLAVLTIRCSSRCCIAWRRRT
jgi:glutamate racemase